MVRFNLFKCFLLAILVFACIFLINFPINLKIINIAIILLTSFIIIYVLFLTWKIIYLRYGIVAVTLIILIILFLVPGNSVNYETLRKEYVNSLINYDGTKYLAGGENYIGIDCSGLVRKGLIDAYIKISITNFSPQCLKKALYLRYFDASAAELLNGYHGYTQTILKGVSLNILDYSKIKAGDFMVTEDGSHTMAYVGNYNWIHANPISGKVVIEKTPGTNWFIVNCVILRWKDLN